MVKEDAGCQEESLGYLPTYPSPTAFCFCDDDEHCHSKQSYSDRKKHVDAR